MSERVRPKGSPRLPVYVQSLEAPSLDPHVLQSPEHFALAMSVSSRTVYRWIKSDNPQLEIYKVGRVIRLRLRRKSCDCRLVSSSVHDVVDR